MSTTRPAIEATMGSTTYWLTTMTAAELSSAVRVANETESWVVDDPTQRRQRELKANRIHKELAPYLQNHPHRFWGSIIVLVEPGSAKFEPIDKFRTFVPEVAFHLEISIEAERKATFLLQAPTEF